MQDNEIQFVKGLEEITDKVIAAQNEGAIAVIIANNLGTEELLFMTPGSDPSGITIPAISAKING